MPLQRTICSKKCARQTLIGTCGCNYTFTGSESSLYVISSCIREQSLQVLKSKVSSISSTSVKM